MGLRIQNNIEAFNTHRQLTATATEASKSMEKLSSGYRINRAADDAAGLGISEKMRGQIGGLAQAQRNAQDGISLVQTAEGALGEVHSMLQRVRDLKVQFNNGTLEQADRDSISAEVAEIGKEVSSILSDTQFNGKTVFGSSDTFSFQVGANDSETIDLAATTLSSATVSEGVLGLANLSTATGASAAEAVAVSEIDEKFERPPVEMSPLRPVAAKEMVSLSLAPTWNEKSLLKTDLPLNSVLLTMLLTSLAISATSDEIDVLSLSSSVPLLNCTFRSRTRCSMLWTSERAPSAVWTAEMPSCALRWA